MRELLLLSTFLAGPAMAASNCTATGGLNYSIGGLPSTGNSILLQQASGTYDLLIWNEGSSATVNVSLGASGTINVYDPTQSATPIQTATGSSVSVNLTDHMIIVELKGAAGGGGKPAQSSASFINSIGVNQHLGFGGTVYANASLEIQEMAYLGLKLTRDSAPQTFDLAPYQQVAAAGIQSDFITGPAGQDMTSTLPDEITAMAALEKSNPGSIVSVEGPNELNGQLTYLNGAASTSGPNVAVSMQQTVAQAVHGNPTLAAAGVKVVNVSITNGIPWQAYTQGLGNLDASVDHGNWHIYNNLGAQPIAHVTAMLPDALMSAPGKPVEITEGGYFTATGNPDGVSPAIQAKYNLNFLADDYANGVVRTFLYELMDGSANPAADDVQGTFGLFLADGTPKPSGTALHNLTAILGVATGTDPSGCAVAAAVPATATQVTTTASTSTSGTSSAIVLQKAPATWWKYLPDALATTRASAQTAEADAGTTPAPPSTPAAQSVVAATTADSEAQAQVGPVQAQVTAIETEISDVQSKIQALLATKANNASPR